MGDPQVMVVSLLDDARGFPHDWMMLHCIMLGGSYMGIYMHLPLLAELTSVSGVAHINTPRRYCLAVQSCTILLQTVQGGEMTKHA
jgi:hypothetical protein